MFKTVGIVARLDVKESLKLASELAEDARKKGLTVFFESELAKKVRVEAQGVELRDMKTDFVITIGGDGTILRTCLSLPKPEPPILAVHMGIRGFLAEVTPQNVKQALDRVLEGKFELERHMKLASFLGKERLPDALNEVYISAGIPAKLFYAGVWKDGVRIAECRADGLVVATQVGSTGYSLSAGGPVLDPDLNAFVFTPVCPLTVFHPVVFPAEANLTVEVLRPEKALIVIDGHYRKTASAGTRLTVTKSENETLLIRFKKDFYQRLASRLLFVQGEEKI